MPKRKLLKCYFGCPNDGGMIHRFPSANTYRLEYQLSQKDRYDHWKSVLDKDTIEKGDDYIRHSIFICYKHFEERYKTPNGLVRNAIPTLQIEPWDPDKEEEYNKLLKSEDSEPNYTETLMDDDYLSTTTIENDNTHLKYQKTITRLKSKLADLRNKYNIQRNKIREVKRLSRNKYLSNLLFSCSWCRRLNKIVNGRICKFNRQFIINKSKNKKK